MKEINALEFDYQELNGIIREAEGDILVNNCLGERFIGSGLSDKKITINGTPGNALGSYLDGATCVVNGNAQDAVGDTMNDGQIYVHGNAGDALGYAMRGGKIFVRGNSGYRTGIHMKQYKDKCPIIVVGGSAGSFLGEYLAGGKIIVLGLDDEAVPVGNFAGTGMHGGEVWIRSDKKLSNFPPQVTVSKERPDSILDILNDFAKIFNLSIDDILSKPFYRLTPNVKNPYKQLYTEN